MRGLVMSASPRTALLIRNPASGSSREQALRLERFLDRLAQGGVRCEVRVTERPGHAVELARREVVASAGFDCVIAAGGDGTVHEVASGLIAGGSRVALAVAPFGRGNDIAQLVGVSGAGLPDDEAALRAILEPRPVTLDTIRVSWLRREGADGTGPGGESLEMVRHAILFGGVGFVGELLRRTTPATVRWFGPRWCYSAGFFRALFSFRPPVLRVRSEEGQEVLPHAVVALAGNAPFAGGGLMRIGPGASMTDGLMELTLIEAVGRLELALQFVRLLRGTHVRHRKVRFFRGRWLEVSADPEQPLAFDGELLGTSPVRFEVARRSLTLLTGPGSRV
ncbi:MAG: diacylglycerol kinase family lipid kinase [Verrucomicrobia bacterium]|nr:diacylglycerol kinase family lipid kinase [Verrucomicrobiota bacterium]